MSSTIRRIVDDALSVLGEVAGAGVSTYSEDRMMNDAIRSFNLLFKKYHWPHMTEWFRFQLDGVLGIPPADTFAFVRDIEDFVSVHLDANHTPLPVLNKKLNPYAVKALQGAGNAQAWTFQPVSSATFPDRYLQFYPLASTSYINVCARVYPLARGVPWDWADEMPLDHDMLVCGTAFMTLSSDDSNPGATDAQRNMMEIRYRDIIASLADQPIITRSPNASVPNEWVPYIR
jgi:hypothetical protein